MRLKKVIDTLKEVLSAVLFFSIIIFPIIACILDTKNENKEIAKYGPQNYEIQIVEKYETLGSTFHIIGLQRSTEKEYHIIYTYRLTNRPNEKHNTYGEEDVRVPYKTYRKYHDGQTFNNSVNHIPMD